MTCGDIKAEEQVVAHGTDPPVASVVQWHLEGRPKGPAQHLAGCAEILELPSCGMAARAPCAALGTLG